MTTDWFELTNIMCIMRQSLANDNRQLDLQYSTTDV